MAHPPYKASQIANFFLRKATEESKTLSQMQLIKLVYIAHGWHLALTNEPLIAEDIQAWKHGPVIRSLWDEFKKFGSGAIEGLATELDENFNVYYPDVSLNDHRTYVILEKVWDIYKGFTAAQLRAMTHEKDSPWSEVYAGAYDSQPLKRESIRIHYQKLITEMLSYEPRI